MAFDPQELGKLQLTLRVAAELASQRCHWLLHQALHSSFYFGSFGSYKFKSMIKVYKSKYAFYLEVHPNWKPASSLSNGVYISVYGPPYSPGAVQLHWAAKARWNIPSMLQNFGT